MPNSEIKDNPKILFSSIWNFRTSNSRWHFERNWNNLARWRSVRREMEMEERSERMGLVNNSYKPLDF